MVESLSACGELSLPDIGRIAVQTSARGLRRVLFLDAQAPPLPCQGAGRAAHWRDFALAELRAYAQGRELRCPIDDVAWSLFQRRFAQELRAVPRGVVITYGALAARLGQPHAARAIGRACARNPVPLWVPCHRVLAADGLGGFSGGAQRKRALLALEGVTDLEEAVSVPAQRRAL